MKYGIKSLQGGLVDIIFLIRHKDVANKQVASMGYYFSSRSKKAYFHPIMGHICALFPILGLFRACFGHQCPIVFEVNHEYMRDK